MSSRMRKTHGKTRRGRNHHALKEARLSKCQKCASDHLRHHACSACGSYRGREVINTTKALEKKLEKQRVREEEMKNSSS